MLRKDFFREIKKNAGRFISIFCIVLLGTAFYAGIRSANYDMKYTADRYFDRSNLMDIRVIGSLGLTEQDLEDMRNVSGVEAVEGGRTQEVLWDTEVEELVLKVIAGTEKVNKVTVKEGRLPEKKNECLIDQAVLERMECKIGDQISLSSGTEEALEDSLNDTVFTIVGCGYLPYYMDLSRGTGAIGDGHIDAFLVVPSSAFRMEIYTEAYVQVKDARDMQSYSDQYEEFVAETVSELKKIGEEASKRRYEEVYLKAEGELRDAQKQVEEGEQELNNGKADLEDGRQQLEEAEALLKDKEKELADGRIELQEGEQELAAARAQIQEGGRQIREAEERLEQEEAKLSEARAQYQTGLTEYQSNEAAYEQQKALYEQGLAAYEAGERQYAEEEKKYQAGLAAFLAQGMDPQTVVEQFRLLDEAKTAKEKELEQTGQDPELDMEYQSLKARWEALRPAAETAQTLLDAGQKLQESRIQLDETGRQLEEAKEQLTAGREQLDQARSTLEEADRQIQTGSSALEAGRKELIGKRSELTEAQSQLEAGESTLEEARQQIEDGEQQLKDGKNELEEKRNELKEGEAEYQKGYDEAQPELSDARRQIEDGQMALDELEIPKWYVLDRNTIPSYVSFGQDAERMKNLGEVFPVIFFLVAALVSLTAMTRMVEEQRLQIGTLKALGYKDGTIAIKYFSYAMLATVGGSICGIWIGEKALPYVIMKAYGILYTGLPEYLTPINWDQAALSLVAASASTGIATLVACFKELRAKPAELMRPEAPKGGKRVFLERITLLWKRLNFTQKSTLRNLIRYKKRFFMTIIGIGGCMALMLVGFGLKDSITEIAKRQYVDIFTYDASVTLNMKITEEKKEEFLNFVLKSEEVEGATEIHMDSVELSYEAESRTINLFVPSETETISEFLSLRDRISGEIYGYPKEGIALTEKAASILHISVGDLVQIKRGEKETPVTVKVTKIVENYIQHYAFLSSDTYTKLFGEAPSYDYLYLNNKDTSEEAERSLGQELMKEEACAGISFVTELEKQIEDMLQSLNIVIYVLIISAGLLAFVVLYNLNSINITERRRELATLKVLGFYDQEVAMYVYRENLLLTAIGILAGVLMGAALHQVTIRTVEIDLMMFGRNISAESFLLSGILTMVFSVLVNVCMFYRLRKIDMIESLKSVE